MPGMMQGFHRFRPVSSGVQSDAETQQGRRGKGVVGEAVKKSGPSATDLEVAPSGESDLTNEEWEKIAPLLPPQKPKVGRPASDHRRIVNGILWVVRTGASWRRLPARYGSWRTVASRFYRWRKQGLCDRIFAAIQQQPDVDAPSMLKGATS